MDGRDPFAAVGMRSKVVELPQANNAMRLGPLEKIYLIWMVGGSCDGCTIAVTGATNPRVEHLLAGIVPGLPKLELIHTVTSVESGPEWVHNLFMAERGELDAPFVVTWEGSMFDETRSGDGYFMGLGEDPETGRTITSAEWMRRLAPKAAAVIAIGTCATWGGIPAAEGNPTGSMAVMDYLGKDYRSAFGVPVVNVPGCSPIGDNYMETAAAVLLFLQGLAPLPEFDELGRPAWLFGETVHRHCPKRRLLRRRRLRRVLRGQGVLGRARLLGARGPVQHRRARHPQRDGWLHADGGHLHRVHDAGLPRQVLAYSAPPGSFISSRHTSRNGRVHPQDAHRHNGGQEPERPLGRQRGPIGLGAQHAAEGCSEAPPQGLPRLPALQDRALSSCSPVA